MQASRDKNGLRVKRIVFQRLFTSVNWQSLSSIMSSVRNPVHLNSQHRVFELSSSIPAIRKVSRIRVHEYPSQVSASPTWLGTSTRSRSSQNPVRTPLRGQTLVPPERYSEQDQCLNALCLQRRFVTSLACVQKLEELLNLWVDLPRAAEVTLHHSMTSRLQLMRRL